MRRYKFDQFCLISVRKWNGEEAMKSLCCSVLDITLFFLFFISPVLLFYLHYFIIFRHLLCISFCQKERPSGDSIPVSLVQVQRSNRCTSQSTMLVEKSTSWLMSFTGCIDWWVCWCFLTKRFVWFLGKLEKTRLDNLYAVTSHQKLHYIKFLDVWWLYLVCFSCSLACTLMIWVDHNKVVLQNKSMYLKYFESSLNIKQNEMYIFQSK